MAHGLIFVGSGLVVAYYLETLIVSRSCSERLYDRSCESEDALVKFIADFRRLFFFPKVFEC